jgi:hypothetical protein
MCHKEGEGMEHNQLKSENQNSSSQRLRDQAGAIAIPAILWFAGVPLGVVILLWLLFFRG